MPPTPPSSLLTRPALLTIGALAVCANVGACLPSVATSAAPGVAVVDDFSDADLAARYHVQGGSWRVVDGALSTLGDRNLPLWLNAPLSKNVRIEFTSRSSAADVDMKVEVFGDGTRHESGYIVILGGWKNSTSVIARLDEHQKDRVQKRTRWEQDKLYRWTIERTDGKTLTVAVDGVPLLSYADAAPLYGPRNNRFAFSGWESSVTFDDLVITPLPD